MINDNSHTDFLVSSYNPGRLYENIDGETTYSISLNNKFPEKILMTIDTEDNTESVELDKIT